MAASIIATPSQIAQAAYNAGFRGIGLVYAVAIALAETGGTGNTQVINSAGDRGLWQINAGWHPEISTQCALDINCAAQAAYKISNGGTDWSQWTTYNNGLYKNYMNVAQSAASAVSSTVTSIASGALALLKKVFGYVITQPFGCTGLALETPVSTTVCPSGYTHLGVDFNVPYGTQLPSLISGTVQVAGGYDGYGNAVIVSNGTQSVLYGHLSQLNVNVGQNVTVGQVLGLSGNSGVSTGPHLHVGEMVNGQWVNPLPLIQQVTSGQFVTSTTTASNPITGTVSSWWNDLLGAIGGAATHQVLGGIINFLAVWASDLAFITFGGILIVLGLLGLVLHSDTGKQAIEIAAIPTEAGLVAKKVAGK